jgi:hypothetical protein
MAASSAILNQFLDAVAVEDSDLPARIPDQPRLLQGMGLHRNGTSTHAEHLREKFLGHGERGASDYVLRLQKPAAKAH